MIYTFGPYTKLLDINFGHKGLAVWNVGVSTNNLSPPGSGVIRPEGSSGLPPPPLSNQQLAALIKKYPVNTTVLAQSTPATATFRFQDLALPPVGSANADAFVQAVPPAPETQFTDKTNAYLLSLQPKISDTQGVVWVLNGATPPFYPDQTVSFTIPLWVTIVGKKFA